jgi:hypothetical protein
MMEQNTSTMPMRVPFLISPCLRKRETTVKRQCQAGGGSRPRRQQRIPLNGNVRQYSQRRIDVSLSAWGNQRQENKSDDPSCSHHTLQHRTGTKSAKNKTLTPIVLGIRKRTVSVLAITYHRSSSLNKTLSLPVSVKIYLMPRHQTTIKRARTESPCPKCVKRVLLC